jgi:hypothetical protein
MIRLIRIAVFGLFFLIIPEYALAGEFYQLAPAWFGYLYYLLMLAFIVACLYTSYLIYNTMKGGKLGLPWMMFLISFIALLLRTMLGFMTFIDVAYFKAVVLAILDFAFIIPLMIGLLVYKENLD